ncbi:MAG: SsrA-binding protein SmpB [Candidatus Omnitrophica bacterium]|nr:SsrA-binding protein SmpB [Candidatus Omnitrophota bacterium]
MGEAIITNRKAFRDYFFTDRWECGIELIGAEVKSIRAGNVSFKDTFARFEKGQMYLYNLHIEPYKQASYENLEPDRPRKLLLHKKEVKKLENESIVKSLTIIPTKLYYNKRGFVKVEIALSKGKKFYDKREDIKKRQVDKDLKRAVHTARKR